MRSRNEDEVGAFWDAVAEDWRVQVGERGDVNRRFSSDPVLWRLLGEVRGKRVLDAGCGTGYLAGALHERGARVIAVDLSERMVELARRHHPGPDYRPDSVSRLATVGDGEVDALVANYVLMDTPDLEGAVGAFHRVLAPGGVAVLVFSHPCFPQGRREEAPDGTIRYAWDFPYFERGRQVDPPWKHFRRDFIWFHRPLSDYWKAFVGAGFAVEAFEEPRYSPGDAAEPAPAPVARKLSTRPYSVAFLLRKGSD